MHTPPPITIRFVSDTDEFIMRDGPTAASDYFTPDALDAWDTACYVARRRGTPIEEIQIRKSAANKIRRAIAGRQVLGA